MLARINTWLHHIADRIVGRSVVVEGFGPIHDVGNETFKSDSDISNKQVDLGGWHVILVGSLAQARSAFASLDMKCVREREILPLGERGYLIRWK